MAIKNIITRGYAFLGTIKNVVLRGYTIGVDASSVTGNSTITQSVTGNSTITTTITGNS